MWRCWRDHSLSIVSLFVGVGFFAAAWPFRPPDGVAWDYLIGLGHGMITVAALNFLAGKLRERNRPED